MAKSPLMKLLKKALRPSNSNSFQSKRRQFLKQTAAVSAGLAVPSAISKVALPKVGIIGAGAAGLACAYALSRAQIPFHIYEGSSRVGGRILTADNWNSNNQFVEIGGELLDSSHQVIFDLARHLEEQENLALLKGLKFTPSELQILRFSEGEQNNLEKALFVVDGQIYFEKQLIDGIQPLVERTQALNRSLYPGTSERLNFLNYAKFPEAVKMDLRSMAELFQDFEGLTEPWILKAVLSAYESEFGREAEQQSALNFLSLMDENPNDGFSMFGESDEAFRLKKGNSSLIRAVLNSLSQYGKLPIESFLSTGCVLTKVEREGSGLSCSFQGAKDQSFTHLVLTLPVPLLRSIQGLERLNLSQAKMRMIQSLGSASNSKAMIDFKNKFWRNSGRISNQGEHFVSKDSQVFWETSRLQNGEHGILTNFISGKDADLAGTDRPMKSLETLNHIYQDRVHKSYSGKSVFMDWQKNPWSRGSYAVLKPGQYSQFWGTGPIPELENRLIFAGEHTSIDFQGFMNGAYESGFRAARQIIKS